METGKFCQVLNNWTEFEVSSQITRSPFLILFQQKSISFCSDPVLQSIRPGATVKHPNKSAPNCDPFTSFIQLFSDHNPFINGRI